MTMAIIWRGVGATFDDDDDCVVRKERKSLCLFVFLH